MALSALVELILQPVAELVFQLAGYLTGCIVVPVITLGHVFVEPDRKGTNFNSGGRIKRRPDGKFVMEAELGSLCGIVFWVLIAASAFIFNKYS